MDTPTLPQPDSLDTSAARDPAAERLERSAGARRPRVWTVFLAFGLGAGAILLLTLLLAAGVAAGLVARSPDSAGDAEALAIATSAFLTSSAGLVLAATISSGTLITAALLGGLLSPQRLRERLRLSPGPFPVPYLPAVLVGLCLSQSLDSTITLQGWAEGSSLEMISLILAGATPLGLAFALLTIGLLAGAGEELFFRGYMQTRLSARWGRAAGVLIVAALFGLLHMDPTHTPFAFLFGIYLGWLAERSGSILPAIAVHIANNCASVVQTRLIPPPLADGTHLWLLAISLILGGVSIVVLRRAFARQAGVPEPAGQLS